MHFSVLMSEESSSIPPTSPGTAEQKDHIRQLCREAVRKISADEKAHRSARLVERIAAHCLEHGLRVIGSFAPIIDREPDLIGLHDVEGFDRAGGGAGLTIAYPRLIPGPGRRMAYHRVGDPDELRDEVVRLPSGRDVTLSKPPPETPEIALSEIELLLVPGWAFTESGLRLGKGGGYYDCVLASTGLAADTAGVCFREQVLTAVPVEGHDQPVNRLFTA